VSKKNNQTNETKKKKALHFTINCTALAQKHNILWVFKTQPSRFVMFWKRNKEKKGIMQKCLQRIGGI